MVTHLVAIHVQVRFHLPVTNGLANARIAAKPTFANSDRQMIKSLLVVFLNTLLQIGVQQEQGIQRRLRHYGKFIAADSKAVPMKPISLLDRLSCSDNQYVASLMSKGIIGVLEAVHIHQEHRPVSGIGVFLGNVF